ncbi:RskA family anti-sigma factor [Nocardia sp. IBHARD005]|uniref:RskA family anti-sigma factor n=1 Tax=Nocardia sp. IBHARD005 TaxID=3457765 RepID=UPI004059B400
MSGQRGPQPPPGVRGGGTRIPAIVSGADDREEMRALYRATGAAAFGLALRVLHRRGAAEDVVREGYRRARAAQWIVDEDDSDRESAARPAESADDTVAGPPPRPGPDLGTPWGRSAFVATEQRSDLAPHTYGSMDVAFGRGVVYTSDGSRRSDHEGTDHTDSGSRAGPDHLGADYQDHEGTDGAGRGHPGPRPLPPDHPEVGRGHPGPGNAGTDRLGTDQWGLRTDRPGAGHPGTERPGVDHPGAAAEIALGSPAFTPDQSWLLAQIHRLAVQRLRLDRRGGDDMPWLAAAARLGFDDPLDSHCEIFVLAYYGGRTYRAIGRELGLRVPMVTRLLAESIERLAEQRIDQWTARGSWCPPGSVLSLADAYALDAVAELEHHHIENKLTATTANSLSQFATRVRGVHEVLALLAADDQHTPPRALETRILADLGTAAPQRRGHWTARPPWLRRFGSQPDV